MRASFDRQSMISGCTDRRSFAPSLILNDFNGKKAKIIQTLKQIDEFRSGVVKSVVFQNLVGCLEVEVDANDFQEGLKKFGLTYQGVQYVRYEQMVRLMHYDNHSERWIIKKASDADVMSVITENPRGKVTGHGHLNAVRMSHDNPGALRNKPSLKRESLRNALIRQSVQVGLTAESLADLNSSVSRKELAGEDDHAVEVLNN